MATRHFAARIVGHQQLTDAYLLGLAIQQKGKLVTLRSVATLLEDSTLKEHLEILEV